MVSVWVLALLRQWISQPLLDLPALVSRQEAVAELVASGILRAKLVGMLGKVGDIERLINRVVQGIATPRDLVGLKSSLEVMPAVREALAALPQDQRQVIQLMYFNGLSQSRIAEHLSLPLGTVKSRTLLGMRRLRGSLAGMER